MHPIMTFMPSARAVAIILYASLIPVDFINLTLIPSNTPIDLRMSARRTTLSSPKMGSGLFARSHAVSSG